MFRSLCQIGKTVVKWFFLHYQTKAQDEILQYLCRSQTVVDWLCKILMSTAFFSLMFLRGADFPWHPVKKFSFASWLRVLGLFLKKKKLIDSLVWEDLTSQHCHTSLQLSYISLDIVPLIQAQKSSSLLAAPSPQPCPEAFSKSQVKWQMNATVFSSYEMTILNQSSARHRGSPMSNCIMQAKSMIHFLTSVIVLIARIFNMWKMGCTNTVVWELLF